MPPAALSSIGCAKNMDILLLVRFDIDPPELLELTDQSVG